MFSAVLASGRGKPRRNEVGASMSELGAEGSRQVVAETSEQDGSTTQSRLQKLARSRVAANGAAPPGAEPWAVNGLLSSESSVGGPKTPVDCFLEGLDDRDAAPGTLNCFNKPWTGAAVGNARARAGERESHRDVNEVEDRTREHGRIPATRRLVAVERRRHPSPVTFLETSC